MSAMKLAIVGAGGRMGRALTRLVHETEGCEVVGGLEAAGSPFIGQDMGELAGIGPIGVAVEAEPLELFTRIDGIIDFSTPETSVKLAELAAQARIVDIIGTTGCSPEQDAKIAAAGRHATIVKSGNMSLGVNLLAVIARKVAAALDESYDIEIVEMHHRNKVDAPSGTALLLGEAVAAGRQVALRDASVRVRDGHTGAREKGTIGFATLRGGSVIGDHTIIFAGDSERIELGHRAENRDVFARGAVKAALWARGRKPGLYSMTDVLGLSD